MAINYNLSWPTKDTAYEVLISWGTLDAYAFAFGDCARLRSSVPARYHCSSGAIIRPEFGHVYSAVIVSSSMAFKIPWLQHNLHSQNSILEQIYFFYEKQGVCVCRVCFGAFNYLGLVRQI